MQAPVTPLPDGFELLAWAARNRAGLPRVDYSADDLASLRARLRQRLPAALPGWNPRLADDDAQPDFATLLTDLFALLAANLAAHADHRANEGWLRTASGPRALMDLAALLDVRLAPGASAATLQAFFTQPDQAGALPAGLQLSHRLAGGQTLLFETTAALAVHPSRNAMRVQGWNRSEALLRLRRAAGHTQDSSATLDGDYPGLRAGSPLVFVTPTQRLALPLAAAATDTDGLSQLRWTPGAATQDADLAVADLVIEGRPRQVAQLAAAARADELPLGSNRLPLADASAFAAGDVALLHSGGLRLGVRILARNGLVLTLGRGLPTALRRSQTTLLAARWCGETSQALRPGSLGLPRSPKGHQNYPHTPNPGDVLLIEDAGGVELATVASATANALLLTEPLSRAMRPGPNVVDSLHRVRFYALDPDAAATPRSATAPVLLRDLPHMVDADGRSLLALDRACDALLAGSSVVLSDGAQVHADTVDEVSSVDQRTLLRLAGSAPGSLQVARLTVYGAFEHRMRLAGADRSLAWLEPGATELAIDGWPAGLVPGLDLVLSDGRAAEGARVQAVQSSLHRGAVQRITLARPTEQRYRLAELQLHGNVAPVSQGAGERDEVLGSGNPQAAPQRFMLRRSPLAWVADPASSSGLAPALQVWVGEQRWQWVDWLDDSGPQDHHYRVEVDEQQRAHLVFGDGVQGAAPASGRDNIRARYRVGLGRQANLPAGTLAKLVAPPPFLARSLGPLPMSGGADPDTPDQARARVRRHARTLQRAVSLADHADLALAFGGVAAARADWQVEGRGAGARRLLVVAVAGTGGQPLSPPQRDALLAFLAARSAEPARLRVRGHRPWPVHLALRVVVAADRVQAQVQAALAQAFGNGLLDDGRPAYFAFERRPLGSALALSDVYRVASDVPGVDQVLATAFHAEAVPAHVADRIALPADAQASGGHAGDPAVGRLALVLQGGLPS